MEVTEKIQAVIERQKELIAKVEVSMGNVPAKCKDYQLFALEQLKSELTIWEVMLSEQKL